MTLLHRSCSTYVCMRDNEISNTYVCMRDNEIIRFVWYVTTYVCMRDNEIAYFRDVWYVPHESMWYHLETTYHM